MGNAGIGADYFMARAVVGSTVLHVVLFLVTAFGLPFVAKDPLMLMSPPVTVEIMTVDEITQTNKPPKKAPPADNKPNVAPTMQEDTPPDLQDLYVPDSSAPATNESVPMPDETVLSEAQPIPRKPISKPKPPKDTSVSKPKTNDFQSLLKNLAPDAGERSKRNNEDNVGDETESSPSLPLSERMTISELDSLKRQIEPCWNVPAGAKFAENLAVEIKMFMNPDATVRQAIILDMGRYNRDAHFRAAADSALRAVRNPRCSPLRLPPGKYDQWKVITIRFNPQDML